MVEQLRGVFALAIWDGDRCGELLPQDDFGIKPPYSDGIEVYEDARRRVVEMDGFPLCSIDDVLESKRRSNRAKDRESLPRLEGFAPLPQARAATGDRAPASAAPGLIRAPLMGLERTRRIELLAERPPLTGTRWDALLPAVVDTRL